LWIALAATSGLICFPEPARAAEDADAREPVGAALCAMGGQEKFEVIHSAAFKGIEHRYVLEQSERPEGPWLLGLL